MKNFSNHLLYLPFPTSIFHFPSRKKILKKKFNSHQIKINLLHLLFVRHFFPIFKWNRIKNEKKICAWPSLDGKKWKWGTNAFKIQDTNFPRFLPLVFPPWFETWKVKIIFGACGFRGNWSEKLPSGFRFPMKLESAV